MYKRKGLKRSSARKKITKIKINAADNKVFGQLCN